MARNYKMVAATDIGQVREVNEDSLRVIPSINLAVVADGMGGHKAGDVASKLAVASLCEYFEEQALIRDEIGGDATSEIMSEAFALANSHVYANSHQIANCEGMGTTLIAASFQENQIHVGHIGDSRFYQFSHGNLTQLTVDHTLATEMSVDTPDMELPAYSHHVLRKALGIESTCDPDYFSIEPESDKIYLLCSDGLSGTLSNQEISTFLTLKSHQPEQCAENLIDACLDMGAPDNISIVIVQPY